MAKATVTIYEKPTCSTCRLAMAILRDMGVEFDAVNYYEKPLTEKKPEELVEKMGIPPRELLRTKEPAYKELKLAEKNPSDEELIRIMAEYPDLMQRPIRTHIASIFMREAYL